MLGVVLAAAMLAFGLGVPPELVLVAVVLTLLALRDHTTETERRDP